MTDQVQEDELTKLRRENDELRRAALLVPQTSVLHVPSPTLKLDLACGQTPLDGFEGVDLWCKTAKHQVDLQRYPWPWADNSVDEVFCSHYCEHIPMEYVDERGDVTTSALGKDALFKFFDELWRVLKPDAWATIIVPCARSNRGFQDPTHRRFFVAETFMYLFAEMRRANKLDHYNVSCNFAGDVQSIVPQEMNALSPEAQQRRFNGEWNVIVDWHAKLKAIK